MASTTPLVIAADPVPLTTNADGVVLVKGTRVPLDTVVYTFNEGATAEEIVQRYPSLHLADVYSVIGYYLRHHAEIDAYLSQRREYAEEIRRQHEARFDPTGLRDRLLARRAGGKP